MLSSLESNASLSGAFVECPISNLEYRILIWGFRC